MQRVVTSLLVLWSIGLMLGGAPASAQLSSPPPHDSLPARLDVPYLSQSELLCGGAAVAMVERFWGRRGVYAEDYASLVRPVKGGISTVDLVDALRARGYAVKEFDGTPDGVQQLLQQRIPVIALIEVARNRYHYVVLLEWSGGRVVYHDPARAPSRTLPESEFLKQWRGGAQWAMIFRPGTPVTPPVVAPAPSSVAVDSLPCRPYMDQALDAVAIDSLQRAATLLTTAQRVCPTEPLVQRELAGVRFKQKRYDQATLLAESYLQRIPDDTLAWRVLAASRYLDHYPDEALAAWNQIGEPTVDLTRIDGIRRIRFTVLAEAIDIPHGTQLTLRRQSLARRRLGDIPAVRRSAVGYQAIDGGQVEVRAGVVERPLLEPLAGLLASNAIAALARHRVELTLSTPTGAGELWTAGWRWDRAHPQLSVDLAVPFTLGLPGVIEVGGIWERYRYDVGTAPDADFEETRRSGGIAFGGWVVPSFRPRAELRYDRWSSNRKYLALSAGTEFRVARDRLHLTTTVEHGAAFHGVPSYSRGNLRLQWASAPLLIRPSWSARLGGDLVSRQTPAGLWPLASGEIPYAIPLRAHPRTTDGRLPGKTIGRLILHGGLSGEYPFARSGPFTFAVGAFLDGAQIADPLASSNGPRFYLDAGGGLRVGLLDGELGVLRIDLATGLNDRTTALTVGLHQHFPLF